MCGKIKEDNVWMCEGGSPLVICLVIKKKRTCRVRLLQITSKCTIVQLKLCLHNDNEPQLLYLSLFPPLYISLFSLSISYNTSLLSSSNISHTFPLFPSVFFSLNASFLSLRVLLRFELSEIIACAAGKGRGPWGS